MAEDKVVELASRDRACSTRPPCVGGPLAADQVAMPAEQRLRAGEERPPGWLGQDSADGGEEQTIARMPAGSADLSLEHPKLVTESQDLDAELGVWPGPDEQDLKQESDEEVGD
jgi:hypothetical protein